MPDSTAYAASPRVEVRHPSDWSSGARVTSTQVVTVTAPGKTATRIVRYWHFPDGRLSHIDSLPA
jgi:hypothetical protein